MIFHTIYLLKKLVELKKTFDLDIIINRNPLTNSRTVNIANARNKILDLIKEKYLNYDFFIMIDMDDVCAKPIYIESLIDGLNKKDKWDALFFNNENYYDFWALCFDDFQYSCWHCTNTKKLINIMNNEFKKKFFNTNEFIECDSAFGGFGIYKTNKFINLKYRSEVDLNLFNIDNIRNVYMKYNIQYIKAAFYDCEHRYFHLTSKKLNACQLLISKKYLFPPYIGEHTKILQ